MKILAKLSAFFGMYRRNPRARVATDEAPGDPFVALGQVIALTGHDGGSNDADGGTTTGYRYKEKPA
jgi:hypothetical protein